MDQALHRNFRGVTAMLARFSRRASSASDAASDAASGAAPGDAPSPASGSPGSASGTPDESTETALAKARPWLLLTPILLFLAILGAAAARGAAHELRYARQRMARLHPLQNYADLIDGYFAEVVVAHVEARLSKHDLRRAAGDFPSRSRWRAPSRGSRGGAVARGRAAALARQSAAARLWLAEVEFSARPACSITRCSAAASSTAR